MKWFCLKVCFPVVLFLDFIYCKNFISIILFYHTFILFCFVLFCFCCVKLCCVLVLLCYVVLCYVVFLFRFWFGLVWFGSVVCVCLVQRNPDFLRRNGLVSIIGHSLGSVISYDILTNINPVQYTPFANESPDDDDEIIAVPFNIILFQKLKIT